MKKFLLSLVCLIMLSVGLYANVYADGDLQIEDGVLIGYFGANSATDIVIPDGVKIIGDNAFDGYTNIKSVTIPEGVTRIGMNAFRDCKGLSGITLPSSLRYIGADAFCGCTGLTSIVIPDSVTTMMDRTFDGCTGLITARLSSSMDVLRWGTFRDCKKLESVVIPESVTAIKGYAFWNCDRLTDIYYGGTESQWKAIEKNNSDGSEKALAGVNPTIHYSSLIPSTKVKKVILTPKKARVWVGTPVYLTYTIVPETATNQSVTWKSSKPGVATVDDNGVVSTHSRGSATITVKTNDGKKTAKCKITVDGPIALKSLKFNKKKTTLDLVNAKKSAATLTLKFNPTKATDKSVSFSSSDPSVASVVSYDPAKRKVYIRAYTTGQTVIRAVSNDGGFEALCTVNVKDTGLVTGVSLNKKASLKVDKTKKLKAKVKPSKARNKLVHWSSSDESVATVDQNGIVTGISAGTAVIRATTDESGFYKECIVTVK